MRNILSSESWKIKTTVCWGMRDRWLDYDGVEDFCSRSNIRLIQLPTVFYSSQLQKKQRTEKIPPHFFSVYRKPPFKIQLIFRVPGWTPRARRSRRRAGQDHKRCNWQEQISSIVGNKYFSLIFLVKIPL